MIEGLVKDFREKARELYTRFHCEDLAEDVTLVELKGSGSEPIPVIACLGLLHGNEIGGMGVLSSIMDRLLHGRPDWRMRLILALGNIPAALSGQRFISHDLNRCFGGHLPGQEPDRARRLGTILSNADIVFDFHQTQTPCPRHFYPITFSPEAFQIIAKIDSNATILAYPFRAPDHHGSSLGRFLANQGIVGITVELGEMGSDPQQHELGSILAEKLFDLVSDPAKFKSQVNFDGTILQAEPVLPPMADAELLTGLENLTPVQRGQPIAYSGGTALYSQHTGVMFFPKKSQGRKATQINPGEPLWVCGTPVPPNCLNVSPWTFKRSFKVRRILPFY